MNIKARRRAKKGENLYVNSTNEIRATIYGALAKSEAKKMERDNFYWSYPWKKTREAVRLRDDSIDVWEYLKTGNEIPGNIVHHIVPRDDDKSLELEMTNLITVSAQSHEEIETIYRRCPEEKVKIQRILSDEAKRRTNLFIHGTEEPGFREGESF